MKLSTDRLLLLIACGFVLVLSFLYFDKREVANDLKLQRERELRELKISQDSLKLARRELVAEKLLAIKEMQKVTQEANTKVAQAEKLIQHAKKIKPIASRNDHERDSLLHSVID